MRMLRVAGPVLFLLLLCSAQLFAQSQSTTGTIQGKVADASGAVVPGASVEAKNVDTNYARTVTSDGDGRFTFLALPPGKYTVTVSGKQGLATVVQENVVLTVGQSITLNVELKVSQGSERIVVTDTPLVDAVKTESSSTLDQQAVSNTPTLGRKFENLLTLTPGVSISQGPDGDEINFNGQRGIFNNISLDGGDYNNGFFGEQMGGQRAAIDIALEAVGEFQVVASGASAEFGRTAGGVVNVVTKSGTNQVHGSAFEYQRAEALSSNTSDGKPLKNFSREQFGGTIGGPIKKDKMFFFGAYEQIFEELQRPNLTAQVGSTACPVAAPSVLTDESLIGSNLDCQRLALVDYYKTSFNDNEAVPVNHPIRNSALLGKWDWTVNGANKASVSYNFDYSKNKNQTFDIPTYGASANGTEGPSKIQAVNLNWFTTLSSEKLNEAHFTYSRENRPREANGIINPDTGIGTSDPSVSFRFGNPFFLGPNVDEIFWRTQFKDNLSIIKGRHNFKLGGEWIHSRNAQVFRGFFQGRYLFSDTVGFLHYATNNGQDGFGSTAGRCDDGTWTSITTGSCEDESTPSSPLLLYLQGANLNGPATDAAGFSDIANEDFALFAQDKWQVTRNLTLSYGLRWEAQRFPSPTIPPAQTAYGNLLSDPNFPSNGKLPNQNKMFQPRLGLAWDIGGKGKSVFRASAGIYNGHQNMLSQVGSLTTNGVQQQTLASGGFAFGCGGCAPLPPDYPNVITTGITSGGAAGVRVFDKNYKNPRIYAYNAQFEQEVARNTSVYVDFSWSKGVYLTNFLNYNRADRTPPTAGPFEVGLFPTLGEMDVTSSRSHSDYKGVTFGLRKRMSNRFQMEANYVYSRDYDTDSNERDPFNDVSGPALPSCTVTTQAACFPMYLDWARSNRDEPHKFNMYLTGNMPWHIDGNVRIQAHSAQPNATPRTNLTPDRNTGNKDNAYSTVDWRLSRPFKFHDRFELIPMVEMFNTFNSKNNVNTLSAPQLFDFNGFLRVGVGDPREVQLAVKFTF